MSLGITFFYGFCFAAVGISFVGAVAWALMDRSRAVRRTEGAFLDLMIIEARARPR